MPAPSRAMPLAIAAVLALAAVLASIWAALGQLALAAAALLATHAAFRPAARSMLLALAAALAWACVLALAWHFARDHFALRYVWLYSSTELALQLKIANVWGGDEGSTLLLAACCASLAAAGARAGPDGGPNASLSAGRNAGRSAARGSVAAAIAAWYGLTALWLEPFAATPADWLAQAPSQGMNAHLMKPWMLFHAPLVLAAYAWALMLAGPALEALRGRPGPWPALARARARRAWVVLSAGIGFGMLWAFEDAMYGQVWHWDPVQTAVFCLWCLLGAHLHGVAGWGAGRRRWRTMPWAGVLAAAAVPLVMALTRNPLLASSHRYVGADSWMSHLVLALALLLLALRCALAGRRCAAQPGWARERPGAGLGLWLTQLCFLLAAAAAALHLLLALGAGALGLPRPDAYQPFLAMLANLSTGAELAALRAAFAQWDVDGYLLARSLLVPLAGIGLVGGWHFCRRISVGAGRLSLLLALTVMAVVAVVGGVMTRHYAGIGILSQQIVAVLPLLDASLAAGAYLALGAAAWAVHALRRGGGKGLAAALPLAVIHAGAALALWGGLLATALNSYTQHEIAFAGAPTDWARGRHGYAFRLAGVELAPLRDGGVGAAAGVQALTRIEVRGPAGEVLDGQTLYRDSRSPPERYDGPMRQVCELLDYRYARHLGSAGYLLQPLIEQGWQRTLQLWVAPAAVVEALAGRAGGSTVVVVVKVFPFLSLLWAGLLLVLLGSAWLAFFARAAAPGGGVQVR